MREEVEARLADTKEELEAMTAALADAERRIDDVYEQRLSGILEAQESARKEREQAAQELRRARAEVDEERERREVVERQLNALIGSGRTPEWRDRVQPPAAAPLRMPEPEQQSRRAPPEQRRGLKGGPTEQRTPVFHQPPPSKSSSRLSLPKLGRGRNRQKAPGARYTCAVTGIEAPSGSEWELRRHGWIVSGDNALSPEAQADGWQYPDGAALPLRKLPER